MDNPPRIDPRILEAIEACRPGSEDLSDAELAVLADEMAAKAELRTVYDKLKQTDVVLAEAFHDVPVPGGLADRIVDRLASARPTQVVPDGSTATEDNAAESSPQIAKRGRRLRRRWVLSAAVLAVAGSLLMVFAIWGDSEDGLTGGTAEQAAIVLFGKEGNAPPAGHRASDVSPPRAHPFSPQLPQPPGTRWRRIDEFLGRRGVAYDLTAPGQPKATLYVIKRRAPNLRDSPPYNPAYNSLNRCAAAWQSDGLLYVLVVDGSVGRYREVLGMSSRPWA